MNVKSCLYLIRGILYANEVIRCKSINRAAEENNIKASNLSVIINDLEEQLGVKLFKRSTLGCRPTTLGMKIAEHADQLQQLLQNLNITHNSDYTGNDTLDVYISTNLELDDCKDFELKHPEIILNFVNEDIWADVKIRNFPPADKSESYTELHIGNGVKQKIWISCDEQNPAAMAFFDFIVAKLLLLYDQSEL